MEYLQIELRLIETDAIERKVLLNRMHSQSDMPLSNLP
jgi:hypothetical protein